MIKEVKDIYGNIICDENTTNEIFEKYEELQQMLIKPSLLVIDENTYNNLIKFFNLQELIYFNSITKNNYLSNMEIKVVERKNADYFWEIY